VRSLLSRFFPAPASAALPRLSWSRAPSVVYAIGDVHGCLDQLLALEALIAADAAGVEGDRYVIQLGDYTDRGPKSAQVIDHLMAPAPPGFERVCLRGNHDDMLLRAVTEGANISDWLAFGGEETMQSYGILPMQADWLRKGRRQTQMQVLEAYVPTEHLAFLKALPVALDMPGYIFVHAGVRPGLALAQQRDGDLMWIRDEFLESDRDHGAVVVHGHTPVRQPLLQPNQIAVDTACYQTGQLTAVRIAPGEVPRFISTK